MSACHSTNTTARRVDLVFEELCSLGEAQTKKPCPDCGKKAPRIVSSFAIFAWRERGTL